jgi:hypothetical protein
MLVIKTNPVGIDIPIQQFQTDLYAVLIEKLGLSSTPDLYKCYGRCYRNKKKDGYVAENFTGTNDKYEELYYDNKLAVISFFGLSGSIKNTPLQQVEVHLVFFVNINKIPVLLSINHRGDEELHKIVAQAVNTGAYGFSFTSMDFYLENVLKEYPGSIRDERLKFVDMHPSHCFRLNFTLDFDINKNCTPTKSF